MDTPCDLKNGTETMLLDELEESQTYVIGNIKLAMQFEERDKPMTFEDADNPWHLTMVIAHGI